MYSLYLYQTLKTIEKLKDLLNIKTTDIQIGVSSHVLKDHKNYATNMSAPRSETDYLVDSCFFYLARINIFKKKIPLLNVNTSL